MTERTPLASRDAYRIWLRIPLRWRDNNWAGHVDNTVHYGWFIDAVMAWLGAAAIADGDDGRTLFVVESGCRYGAELSYPGDVEIGLAVAHLGTSSVRYRLGVFAAGSEQPAAEGFLVHVCVDTATRRPAPIPPRWRDTFERVIAAG